MSTPTHLQDHHSRGRRLSNGFEAQVVSRGFIALEVEAAKSNLTNEALGFLLRLRQWADQEESDGYIDARALSALAGLHNLSPSRICRLLGELESAGAIIQDGKSVWDANFTVHNRTRAERDHLRGNWRQNKKRQQALMGGSAHDSTEDSTKDSTGESAEEAIEDSTGPPNLSSPNPSSPNPSSPNHSSPSTSESDGVPDMPKDAEDGDEVAKAAAVGGWWSKRSGRTANYKACRRIAQFDVPLNALLEHLESVAEDQDSAGDPVRTLDWFVNPNGISRLHRLQSEGHSRRGSANRSRMTSLGEELRAFAPSVGSSSKNVAPEAVLSAV